MERKLALCCQIEEGGPRGAVDSIGSCAVPRLNSGSCLVWPYHVHHLLYLGPLLDTRAVTSPRPGGLDDDIIQVFAVLVYSHQQTSMFGPEWPTGKSREDTV